MADHATAAMAATPGRSGDEALIDDALAAVAGARARAPRDFIFALAAVLATLAVALVVVALIVQGTLHDLLLNLASEVVGAWLTVILVDGLWKRMEAGASASLDDMRRNLEARRGAELSAAEREAWRAFSREHGELERRRSLLGRVLAVPRYGRRLSALEHHGNRTLAAFDPRRRARDERLR